MPAGQAWRARLRQQLDAIHRQGLHRRRTIRLAPATGCHAKGQGAPRQLDFCSNDYLGLSNDVRLIKTMQQAVAEHGLGSGGSPLICGYSTAHARLEARICALTGYPRALVFGSGYLANLALVGALANKRQDSVLMDKYNHASLIDGGRLAAARLRRYPHRNLQALGQLLAQRDGQMVITEGIFSMSGALADLGALAALCKRRGALLAVDDAHGLGVLGAAGAGSINHHGLSASAAPLMMATLGKAAGVHGAFIAGDGALIELLLQRGRSYMYSTALPPALAATAGHALELLATESWRREKLFELIGLFRCGAQSRGLPIMDSATPIQALIIKGNANVLRAGRRLAAKGLHTGVIRSPTVPRNTERIRISLNAALSPADIALLLDELTILQDDQAHEEQAGIASP